MIQGNEYTGLLQVGQVVYSILYGGRSGVIVSIIGEQKPETIRDLGGVVMGGSAQIVVAFGEGVKSTVPEAIVRGAQWKISNEVVGLDVVKIIIAYTERTAENKKQAKVEEAERKEQERADLPSEYPFLTPMSKTPGKSKWAAGAANLRRHLKRAFMTKFKVRCDGNSIRVSWADGPSRQEVERVTGLYEKGHFDGMVDCYYFNDETFHEVFGGAKYVMADRSVSDEAFNQVAVEMGWPEVRRNERGGYDGCDIGTGDMIQRECWGRSF